MLMLQVFLCKFNRFLKALDAIFFESLSILGECSFNESSFISLKDQLDYERRSRKRK